MNSKFIIQKSKDGQWFFNLVAPNNETIGTSEMYTSKTASYKGIAAVRANAKQKENFELKISVKNEPYFVLRSRNSEPILVSEMYSSSQAAEKGIQAVMKYAPNADVLEKYQKS